MFDEQLNNEIAGNLAAMDDWVEASRNTMSRMYGKPCDP